MIYWRNENDNKNDNANENKVKIFYPHDLRDITLETLKEQHKIDSEDWNAIFAHAMELCYRSAKEGLYECIIGKDDIDEVIFPFIDSIKFNVIFNKLAEEFMAFGYKVNKTLYEGNVTCIAIKWHILPDRDSRDGKFIEFSW